MRSAPPLTSSGVISLSAISFAVRCRTTSSSASAPPDREGLAQRNRSLMSSKSAKRAEPKKIRNPRVASSRLLLCSQRQLWSRGVRAVGYQSAGIGEVMGVDGAFAVAVRLADFAPVGQSAFCQGWQLCVKNAASLGWIVTTCGSVLISLLMMWSGSRRSSLAQ